MRFLLVSISFCFFSILSIAQENFTYDANRYSDNGSRVCLVEAHVDAQNFVLSFPDAALNTTAMTQVSRRQKGGEADDWVLLAELDPGTESWIDSEIIPGIAYEYQIKRNSATGYLLGGIDVDQTNYQGRLILVIDESIQQTLSPQIRQLKKDLTGEGYLVTELYVPRVEGWFGGSEVIDIKSEIQAIYNQAHELDKPNHLFLLGHVPVPRSGLDLQAPDGHVESLGARGADTFYADIDGEFTDVDTYEAANLNHPEAQNLPNDLKWDQDHIPSTLEMAFGRVDFADLNSLSAPESTLLINYLDRLHAYRHGQTWMGRKTGFYYGYNNSNDGSFRTLVPISGKDGVYEFYSNDNFPQQIQSTGPYQIFMQNRFVPDHIEWNTSGMDATIFSSDQSYWGFWCSEETGGIGRIRGLLAKPTKCLSILWTTTAVNIFHQMGIGETLGNACKRIMDHAIDNPIYEKPEADWDDRDWWNRNHMQVLGDPTLRINQVLPISNLRAESWSSSLLHLGWDASVDTDIVGYHIYRADTEFGFYERITSEPVEETEYLDDTFDNFNYWYMVRAVKREVTGSGTYLNPSVGLFAQAEIAFSTQEVGSAIHLSTFPNPASEYIEFKTEKRMHRIIIQNDAGQVIYSTHLDDNFLRMQLDGLISGQYFALVQFEDKQILQTSFIVEP